jgi:hypothetical protein
VNACVVVTGFPPFQTVIGPPASFATMDADKRKKCEAMYAEALTLQNKFTTIVDREAQIWNNYLGWIWWMHRQYRGELAYVMIQSGDNKMFEAVIEEIGRYAKPNPGICEDLILFMNAAWMNGELAQYDKAELKRVSKALKQALASYAEMRKAPQLGPNGKPVAGRGRVGVGRRRRPIRQPRRGRVHRHLLDRRGSHPREGEAAGGQAPAAGVSSRSPRRSR